MARVAVNHNTPHGKESKVATRSTIMDTNSFRQDDVDGRVNAKTLAMARRRTDLLGPAYRLFYSNPVHLVRGEGA